MDVGKRFIALTASTDPFVLHAGKYMIAADVGDLDSIALQARSPAGGDSWLSVPSQQIAPVGSGDGGGTLPVSFTEDGVMTADLAAGEYRIGVSGADLDPPANVTISRIV